MPLIEYDCFGLLTRVSGWIARPAYPSRLSAGARVSARIFGNSPLVAMAEGPSKRCLEVWVAVCLDSPHALDPSSHIDHYALCVGEVWLSIPDFNPSLASQDASKLGAQYCINQSAIVLSAGASYQLPNAIHKEGMRRIAMIERSVVEATLASGDSTLDAPSPRRL